jgi:hypothetical protein
MSTWLSWRKDGCRKEVALVSLTTPNTTKQDLWFFQWHLDDDAMDFWLYG